LFRQSLSARPTALEKGNTVSASPTTRPDLVIVCQVFYPELVSTGQTLTELVEELAATGLKITVIAGQPTLLPGSRRVERVLEHKGITIIRTWSTRLPKTSFVGKLLNLTTFFASASLTVLFNYRQAQLLLLTNPPYLPLLGWFCHRLRRQPFGVILFDIMPEQAELLEFIRPDGFIARTWRWFNHLWYRKAAYAVVLSRDMLEGALKNARLLGTAEEEAARARTHVIHVWSDDRLIAPRPKSGSTEASRLGVQERLVVQYSGNHGRFHDIETLLALAASFQPDDGFVFQFIGEGQKKKLVEDRLSLASSLAIYSSCYVPKELLGDSLAMADLGVVAQLPGQERVCYPSKLLGIMAAGRPVLAICPVNCDMARMIREQEIGFVVANGDVEAGRKVLLEARSNPARLRRLGENAARYLREHFTLAQAAQAYFDLISTTSEKMARGPFNHAKPKYHRELPAERDSLGVRLP
jgi:glycosyltransferase involved in cell wall biosynthesis